MSMNPIIKNEPFKMRFLSKLPSVLENAALVLYPHEMRERSSVYFSDDNINKAEIKKWNYDCYAYVSLDAFQFSYTIKIAFSEGISRYDEITYEFMVSIKQDKDSVKKVIRSNITDLAEPVIDMLVEDGMEHFDKRYSCSEYLALEASALNRIQEILFRISYLKILVYQVSAVRDPVSTKVIEDDIANEFEKVRIRAMREELARKEEEANVQKKQVEIAKIVVENETALAEIKHRREIQEKQYEIEKRLKELEAERIYELARVDKVAAIACEEDKLCLHYTNEQLAIVDQRYEKLFELEQIKYDRERENSSKEFDLKWKIVQAIHESGINEQAADELMSRLFLDFTANKKIVVKNTGSDVLIGNSSVKEIEDAISEEGKEEI